MELRRGKAQCYAGNNSGGVWNKPVHHSATLLSGRRATSYLVKYFAAQCTQPFCFFLATDQYSRMFAQFSRIGAQFLGCCAEFRRSPGKQTEPDRDFLHKSTFIHRASAGSRRRLTARCVVVSIIRLRLRVNRTSDQNRPFSNCAPKESRRLEGQLRDQAAISSVARRT